MGLMRTESLLVQGTHELTNAMEKYCEKLGWDPGRVLYGLTAEEISLEPSELSVTGSFLPSTSTSLRTP